MERVRGILFDIDGVLVDSLRAHVEFCRNQAKQYRLATRIDEARIRRLVQAGTPVSPMPKLLGALGFSAPDAARAHAEYVAEFSKKHPVTLFPRVFDMLLALTRRDIRLGFVTANVEPNVHAALGDALAFFDPDARLSGVSDKAAALEQVAQTWGFSAEEVTYVGDQPADEAAAKAAGVRFVAVHYGWGFPPSILGSEKLAVVDVRDLAEELVSERKLPTDAPAELKLALEHARALFIFHAGQRHTTLNYYLVALNVFALAIGTLTTSLLKDHISWLALPITLASLFAWRIAGYFSTLDKRNEQIVHYDEALLKDAERRLAAFTRLPSFETVEACSEKPVDGGYRKIVPRLLHAYRLLFAVIALVSVATFAYQYLRH